MKLPINFVLHSTHLLLSCCISFPSIFYIHSQIISHVARSLTSTPLDLSFTQSSTPTCALYSILTVKVPSHFFLASPHLEFHQFISKPNQYSTVLCMHLVPYSTCEFHSSFTSQHITYLRFLLHFITQHLNLTCTKLHCSRKSRHIRAKLPALNISHTEPPSPTLPLMVASLSRHPAGVEGGQ